MDAHVLSLPKLLEKTGAAVAPVDLG